MNLGRKLAADPVLTQSANRWRHGFTNAGTQIGSKTFELVMRLDVNSHAGALHTKTLTRLHTRFPGATGMTMPLMELRRLSSRAMLRRTRNLGVSGGFWGLF